MKTPEQLAEEKALELYPHSTYATINLDNYSKRYHFKRGYSAGYKAATPLSAGEEITDSQHYLVKCGIDNLVVNNNPDPKKWKYLSDIMEEYAQQLKQQGAGFTVDWEEFKRDFFHKFRTAGKINEVYSPGEIFNWFKSKLQPTNGLLTYSHDVLTG